MGLTGPQVGLQVTETFPETPMVVKLIDHGGQALVRFWVGAGGRGSFICESSDATRGSLLSLLVAFLSQMALVSSVSSSHLSSF